MEKKLPSVFANKVETNAGNNKSIFYSADERMTSSLPNENDQERMPTGRMVTTGEITKDINQKINEIFKSSNYIYKADVELTLRSGKITKRIIGKNASNLITMDNELIPISEIIDIKRK